MTTVLAACTNKSKTRNDRELFAMARSNKTKKSIRYLDAVHLMRCGQLLARMQMNSGGLGWFLIPAGEVTAKTAEALLQRPNAQPNAGALFPGLSQTYRMASANKDNHELRRCGGKARGAHRRNDWPRRRFPWPMSLSNTISTRLPKPISI
jgi:hypothetical protein